MNFESLLGEDREWAYNLLDCSYTRIVGEAEARVVSAFNLSYPDSFQHRLFPAVLQAMVRGVKIDMEERKRLGKFLKDEMAQRESWLTTVLGHPLNVRSPKQMQALFYDDFRLPIVWKKLEDGRKAPTLDRNALKILARKEPLVHPIITRAREIRSIGTLHSNYIEAEVDPDGRMRCGYNVCGTVTYRLSSRENAWGRGRNLQNVTDGGSLDDIEDNDSDLTLPNIKTLFCPDDGKTWFDIDLSKADLRVVVWESDEKEMKAMLAEGRDPYVETAREYYRKPSITKESPEYFTFKRFCHGTHYLATPSGLAHAIGLSNHEAERTQNWYFGKYPAIKKWQERFISDVSRTRIVTNKFGFRRYLFGRIDSAALKTAIAWLPQSTIGILINHIWVNIFETCPCIEVLLQVHDSLNGQFPTHQKETHMEDLLRCSRVVIPYDDPLIIPIGIKTSEKSWGDCQ